MSDRSSADRRRRCGFTAWAGQFGVTRSAGFICRWMTTIAESSPGPPISTTSSSAAPLKPCRDQAFRVPGEPVGPAARCRAAASRPCRRCRGRARRRASAARGSPRTPASPPARATARRHPASVQRPDHASNWIAGGCPAVRTSNVAGAQVDRDVHDGREVVVPVLPTRVVVRRRQELLDRYDAEQAAEGPGQQQRPRPGVDPLAGDIDQRDLEQVVAARRRDDEVARERLPAGRPDRRLGKPPGRQSAATRPGRSACRAARSASTRRAALDPEPAAHLRAGQHDPADQRRGPRRTRSSAARPRAPTSRTSRAPSRRRSARPGAGSAATIRRADRGMTIMVVGYEGRQAPLRRLHSSSSARAARRTPAGVTRRARRTTATARRPTRRTTALTATRYSW